MPASRTPTLLHHRSWNARMRIAWFPTMLFIGAITGPSGAYGQRGGVLYPDLAFHIVCKETARTALEKNIEGFLKSEGFKVLNQARIQREHGVFLDDLHIIGLDDKRRIIDFLEFSSADRRYAVRLNSPPPTHRSPHVEEALLTFASGKLGCQVRQVTRETNGADASQLHDIEVMRIEGLFRQAEELQGQRRL
jgi:hypothetical protein